MSKSKISFEGKVAIVTGAGAGLGKIYADFLARRGAKLVINDLGVTPGGEGHSDKIADRVVAEIKKNGGTAVANHDSVEFGDKIVKTAIDNFGRIDIIVNNAGFVRDKSFGKMTVDDFDKIMKVHLYGHFTICLAAWPHMRNQKYGRIINVGSSSGLYGNFGQANYCAAKMGIHGLTLALAREGASSNIKVNTIAPVAATRMTEGVLSAEFLDVLRPDFIAPFVEVLASEQCPDNGGLYEMGGGWFSKLRWQRTAGAYFDLPNLTAEDVLARWNDITDFGNPHYPVQGSETFQKIVQNLNRLKEEKKYPFKTQVSPVKTTASRTPKADANFAMMGEFARRGEAKDITKRLQAVYNFEIVEKIRGPVLKCWIIDLKNGDGKVYVGKDENADATFTMSDEDFDNVCMGKIHPQQAFAQGKMRIRGGMKKASAFTPDLFPPPTPENIAKYAPAKL